MKMSKLLEKELKAVFYCIYVPQPSLCIHLSVDF